MAFLVLPAAAVAAFGCLRAINTVLDGVSELKHMFPLLENICWPIMTRMISTDGQDLIEDVLEMLAYFTFFAPEISPRLWTLWPQMHRELMDWGVDQWEAFLPPLDNFISRDPETYLRGSAEGFSYQDSVFQMVSRSLSEDFADGDVVPAARLIEVVLQNCRGRVSGGWVCGWGRVEETWEGGGGQAADMGGQPRRRLSRLSIHA